jgi:hypothetical protein
VSRTTRWRSASPAADGGGDLREHLGPGVVVGPLGGRAASVVDGGARGDEEQSVRDVARAVGHALEVADDPGHPGDERQLPGGVEALPPRRDLVGIAHGRERVDEHARVVARGVEGSGEVVELAHARRRQRVEARGRGRRPADVDEGGGTVAELAVGCSARVARAGDGRGGAGHVGLDAGDPGSVGGHGRGTDRTAEVDRSGQDGCGEEQHVGSFPLVCT